MNVPFVVPLYAGIFTLIYIVLTVRVIALRNSHRVSFGTGGDPVVERAVRIHGNFIEYVPLALILLGFMELQHFSRYLLHILCLLLLLGRLSHIAGLSIGNGINIWRGLGVVLTVTVLLIAAILLIWEFFLVLPTT